MEGWQFMWLLWTTVWACSPSDGSALAPFFVNEAASVSPATGDTCAPFPTLSVAVSASANLTAVTLSLQSSVSFLNLGDLPNLLTLLGNSHSISIEEIISIDGGLVIRDATLLSTLDSNSVMSMSRYAALTLHTCTMRGFVSPPISVAGLVVVTQSVFVDNIKGVFYFYTPGVTINITDSQFVSNGAISGAAFFYYMGYRARESKLFVSNCEFRRNGNKGGNGVVAVNDVTAQANHTMFFSRCVFEDNEAATFQLNSKFCSITVEDSQFQHEPQMFTGKLSQQSITLTRVSVSNCKGPLIVLALAGRLSIQSSNLTNTSPGPVVYALGSVPSESLVRMSDVYVDGISNFDSALSANLINAVAVTVWMSDVHLSNFEAVTNGIFLLSQAVVYSNRLSVSRGTAPQFVVGQLIASTALMNVTLFDGVYSRGPMIICVSSVAEWRTVFFRNIVGYWDENTQVYTTNLWLLTSGNTVLLDGLYAELVHPGSTLIYVYGSQCSLSNSRVTGPLGMGLFTIISSNVTVRTSAFDFTAGKSIIKLLLGGYIDIDLLRLQDLTLSAPILAISSHSSVSIQSLVLINVTTMALSKGERYRMLINDAYIVRSLVSSLVHFSTSV